MNWENLSAGNHTQMLEVLQPGGGLYQASQSSFLVGDASQSSLTIDAIGAGGGSLDFAAADDRRMERSSVSGRQGNYLSNGADQSLMSPSTAYARARCVDERFVAPKERNRIRLLRNCEPMGRFAFGCWAQACFHGFARAIWCLLEVRLRTSVAR